jgi:hypothetical protein
VVRALLVVIAMKASPQLLALACVAFGVVAGCGGRSPIEPSDRGSAGGIGGGSTGGQGGTAGTAGAGGTGGSAVDCGPNSHAIYCPDCEGNRVFNRCFDDPGALAACPTLTCPAPPRCEELDEASCKTRADCQAYQCPDCEGGQTFLNCAPPGVGPGFECQLCPSSCAGLDETACANGCIPEYCPNCDGGRTFEGCAAPGGAGIACGLDCPQAVGCDGLGEMACIARTDCRPGYCGCPGEQMFTSCLASNEAVACPAYACPAAAPCATVTTEAACDQRNDCHSVFVSNAIADCVVNGGCTFFTHCADGGKASCNGAPACQITAPYCEAPAFVVSYTGSCYEGCVRATECGP